MLQMHVPGIRYVTRIKYTLLTPNFHSSVLPTNDIAPTSSNGVPNGTGEHDDLLFANFIQSAAAAAAQGQAPMSMQQHNGCANLLSQQAAFMNGQSVGGGANGVGGEQQRKVFNSEAYCELCQKEFCNKYYLATHKATKHGIGQAPSMAYSMSSEQLSDTLLKNGTMFNGDPMNGTLPPNLFTALSPALLSAIIQQRQRQLQHDFEQEVCVLECSCNAFSAAINQPTIGSVHECVGRPSTAGH
jgi:hypothetical protein